MTDKNEKPEAAEETKPVTPAAEAPAAEAPAKKPAAKKAPAKKAPAKKDAETKEAAPKKAPAKKPAAKKEEKVEPVAEAPAPVKEEAEVPVESEKEAPAPAKEEPVAEVAAPAVAKEETEAPAPVAERETPPQRGRGDRGDRGDRNDRSGRGGRPGRRGPGGRRNQEVAEEGPQLMEKVVFINRCAKVVKGGRRFSFSALVVSGDMEGRVGVGFGKANEVADAIRKGTEVAKRSLIPVAVADGTIPHEVYAEYGGGKVLLKPAAEGTGLIAGNTVRAVLEAAGIRNIISKSLGSKNHSNVVKATMQALTQLRTRDQILGSRGKKKEKAL